MFIVSVTMQDSTRSALIAVEWKNMFIVHLVERVFE
jgi:hypothetical protein